MMDVIIVGAGPAGLAASIACAENGLQVKVIDEFMKPGGRLLGQLHEEQKGVWWNGIEQAHQLIEKAESLGVKIECGISVYHLEKKQQWCVHTTNGTLHASSLLLATGAAELSVPVPGWTLPGVMSIGAAQVMTNVHRVRVGSKGIVIGINVLSVAIARELQLAGIEIKGLVLPNMSLLTEQSGDPKHVMDSMIELAHLAPSNLIKWGSKLMKKEALKRLALKIYPKSGMKIWGMPIQMRKSVLEILGKKQVEGVLMADVSPNGKVIPGTEKEVPVDFVCIAGGLYPLAELAALTGCPFKFIPSLGGHVPIHNERMKTPVDGLYVAGNITGIESAKVAIDQGTLAGLSIATDHGVLKQSEENLSKALEKVETTRKEALIQFHPEIAMGREQLKAASAE